MTEAASRAGGELHMTKECSEYTGQPGSFCTLTASNIDGIPVGCRVVYESAAGEKTIESNVTLMFGDEKLVFGHVLFDFTSNTGTLTLTGGTGAFTGLHADAVVTSDGGAEAHWDGTYTIAAAVTT